MAMGGNGGVELRIEREYRSLYALKDFRQGEQILLLPMATQELPDKYSIEAPPGIHLDCSFSLVGAINHSCLPNSAVRNGSVVAWRCIKVGEELTIDYKRTESRLAEPFNCKCSSKKCRGRIE